MKAELLGGCLDGQLFNVPKDIREIPKVLYFPACQPIALCIGHDMKPFARVAYEFSHYSKRKVYFKFMGYAE